LRSIRARAPRQLDHRLGQALDVDRLGQVHLKSSRQRALAIVIGRERGAR